MKKIILFIALLPLWGQGGLTFAQSTFIQPNSVQLPNVSTLGTCTATQKGQQVFLTADNLAYYCNGTAWVEMSGAFVLPFAGVITTSGAVFQVIQSGTGMTGNFINNNAANANSTLRVATTGTGFAGQFNSTNATPKALSTLGGLQFTGISEGVGKILVSDAGGNATWQSTQGKTNYYNASNMDFFPNLSQTTTWNGFVRDHENTRIAYFVNTIRENVFMLAPVDLPDGAVITRLKAFYIDNTSAEKLFIDLIRRDKSTTSITLAAEDIMGTVQSANTNSTNIRTVQNLTIANSTIDNNIYHYFIKVKIGDCSGCDLTQNWADNSLGIRAVELQYTY
jgi:hypothetical protein